MPAILVGTNARFTAAAAKRPSLKGDRTMSFYYIVALIFFLLVFARWLDERKARGGGGNG